MALCDVPDTTLNHYLTREQAAARIGITIAQFEALSTAGLTPSASTINDNAPIYSIDAIDTWRQEHPALIATEPADNFSSAA